MNNKLNIEEIKLLIPDYVTGSLDKSENLVIEKAISENHEIHDFYMEMKDTLAYVETVKLEEPSPVYWNNLLPRIHEKIEQQQSAGFSWEKLSVFWKVFAPVAAIVLIAVLYFALRPSDIQLTEDKKTENVTRDSMKNPDSPKDVNSNENKKESTDRKNELVKENPVQESPNSVEHRSSYYKKEIQKDEQTAKDVVPNDEIREVLKDVPKDENLAADIEESSILASGESAGLDEETEAELKKLDDKDRNKLLEELLNSNL
ncbi:MAG: hypothetical protein IAE90_13980 [Ignavibacteria bacterium]|nr:hypothetical protein [Ignavibacteria bacterium]